MNINFNNLIKESVFHVTDSILSKSYLPEFKSASILFFSNSLKSEVRFCNITQIVLDRQEDSRKKLVSVFRSVWETGGTLLFFLHGCRTGKVSIYFGVRHANSQKVSVSHQILEGTLHGNFPGIEINGLNNDVIEENIISVIDSMPYVSTVTGIAGDRSEEGSQEGFVQGLEKLIDSMSRIRIPQNNPDYALLLIADPVSNEDLIQSRRSLENLYSLFSPLNNVSISLGVNETLTSSYNYTKGFSQAVSKSLSLGVSHTIGSSFSDSVTDSHSTNTTEGVSINKTNGFSVGSINTTGIQNGKSFGGGFVLGKFMISGSKNESSNTSSSKSTTISVNTSSSSNKTSGITDSNSYTVSLGRNETEAYNETKTHGTTDTTSTSFSEGVAKAAGTSTSFQYREENHTVTQIMAKIDEQLKRYDECADLGMWNCAVYCLSDTPIVSQLAADTYQALIRGKNSSLETGGITVWDDQKSREILPYLKAMKHPVLSTPTISSVTPGTLVSSAELAIHAGLPNRSVSGVPVIECARFGRNVSEFNGGGGGSQSEERIELGHVYHMHKEDASADVGLSLKRFCSHTFITGSTGSGKSNTVYTILGSLLKVHEIPFLVIEPAKGEYKHVFGNRKDVSVYGTNPQLSRLLRINPFSFPKGIHVLEHIDRLIEIFNVCWPLYAAMPAVLKDAIVRSYEDTGWDLMTSVNPYGDSYYPGFADVVRNIRTVIDSSEYDSENKGAYKGSLMTRLQSLTNGINGLIFGSDEIPAHDLFDKNVIADLSRVGSGETKALLMGILLLKLQEYRMSCGGMNEDLNHVTVIEEAHNLLKQPVNGTESALQAKSVEMITNAIAEMRTYGEGFIIVDQAPGLLDKAVIRNTNTKILMRLPDKADRELVGKAANLNDDQIIELAKLPCGVAAVYQNEWIEPVLCKVDHFQQKKEKSFVFEPEIVKENVDLTQKRLEVVQSLFQKEETDTERIHLLLDELPLSGSSKVAVIKTMDSSDEPRFTKLAPLVCELLPGLKEVLTNAFSVTPEPRAWTLAVDNAIRELNPRISVEQLRNIRQCVITQYLYNELSDNQSYNKWRNEGVL